MQPLILDDEKIMKIIQENWIALDNLLIVFSEGVLDDDAPDSWSLGNEVRSEILPSMLDPISIGTPTILTSSNNASVYPAAISFFACNDFISFPIFDLRVTQDWLQEFIDNFPNLSDESFPTDVEGEIESFKTIAHLQKMQALCWLSAYLSATEISDDEPWPNCSLSHLKFVQEENTQQIKFVVTSKMSNGDTEIFCWESFWNALEAHDGPIMRTTWAPDTRIILDRREEQLNEVQFRIQDEGGQLTFIATPSDWDNVLCQLFIDHEWEILDESILQESKVQQLQARGTSTQSPTPNVQPTQQRPGANEINGILDGNVNVTGLGRINGIIEGDLLVPPGADVDVRGIVEGRIVVSGGTVRLFGTASGATMSTGRFELYGILSSPLQYSGGDVYYDPNSIIG